TPPELTVVQRIPSGSNAVFRCVDPEGDSWVYKPSAGERPLVDFPAGSLAPREVAAFEVSAALGWDLVPETVEASGPGGPGMAQRWIEEPSDRLPSGSTAGFRCVDPEGASWVYKPSAGERPLVDFPAGSLAPREVAAFEVSAALGWDLVPETVEASGPGGPGMAQRWIEEPSTGVRVGPDPVDVHPLSDVPDDRVAVLRGEGAG